MSMHVPPWAAIRELRKRYPKGTRVQAVRIDDPYVLLPPGTMGTVRGVDDIGTVHVSWDNGSGIGVVYGVDEIITV